MWILLLFFVLLFVWMRITRDRLLPYRTKLQLQKAALLNATDYQKLTELVLPLRKSVFSRSEPTIWQYEQDGVAVLLAANYRGDVRLWFSAPNSFGWRAHCARQHGKQ